MSSKLRINHYYLFLIMHGNVHKTIVASKCIDNWFRIESLTSESELNGIEL